MPQLSSPLSTPAGMPLVNAAHIAKAAGLYMHFATVADLHAAVAAEGSSWPDGQRAVASQEADSGAVRVYRSGPAHARTVQLGPYRAVLGAESNIVRASAGAPASGVGSNGDLSVDTVTGIVYAKASGAWSVLLGSNGEPITTFAANASQGQWVRENIVQNTRDRATAGDYAMIGLATNNGYFQVVKRFADGTFSAPVTLNPAPNGPAEPDDHNVPALLQLPSGRWLAVWNRHGIAGATGFRYAITASPHGVDFGALVVVTGSATWNGGTAASTYTQVYMVGNRVIIFYRVGGSQNGAWVARYSDNIGATTPAWSAEVLVTPTAYMDSAIAPDGVTLRCAMYDHPYNTLGHDIFTFDVNLTTGDMVAPGSSTVIGNIFTNTVPVENTATRKAVAISSGTSRLFNIDAAGNLYGIEMAGGNGSQTWPSGTYYRYVRTAGAGAYTKQAVSETGLPFLGGQQGYYGSICRLDDNRVLVSVNTGTSIGVGAWELREYVTANAGTSWSLATVHAQGSAIIMRPQVLNNLMFWYEATAYASYTSFTASGKYRLSTTAAFTPRASVPAGTDPTTPPLAISGTPPSSATVGTPYSFTPTTTGGTTPYTYALVAGTLPAGLSLSSSTGSITGTPTAAGTAAGLSLRVTDAASGTATLATFSITVTAAAVPLGIAGSPATTGNVGTAYSFNPTASGGTAPYTFSIQSGTLPAGLSINPSTGAITGTPTSAGTSSGIVVRVTDAASATADLAAFNIVVSASSGFANVNVHTLTQLTDIGSNRYQATTAAGSQGAILYTGQKKPAGAAASARLYYNDAGASGLIAVGASTTPNAASSGCPRVAQISAAGILSTVNSGGTSQATGFTFSTRGPGCFAELNCDAAGMWTVRATEDNGATWAGPFPVISSGGTNAPYDVETYLRYYTSYAGTGTTPRERVIDNPQQQGFAL